MPKSMPLKLVDATRRAGFLSSHESCASCTPHVLPSHTAAANRQGAKCNQKMHPAAINITASTGDTGRTCCIQGVRTPEIERPQTPRMNAHNFAQPTQRLAHAVSDCLAREKHCCWNRLQRSCNPARWSEPVCKAWKASPLK